MHCDRPSDYKPGLVQMYCTYSISIEHRTNYFTILPQSAHTSKAFYDGSAFTPLRRLSQHTMAQLSHLGSAASEHSHHLGKGKPHHRVCQISTDSALSECLVNVFSSPGCGPFPYQPFPSVVFRKYLKQSVLQACVSGLQRKEARLIKATHLEVGSMLPVPGL